MVDEALPISTAALSESGPVTKAAAPSPLALSRPPPGAPITTSLAHTSARFPAAATSRPTSRAPTPMREDVPRSKERTRLGSWRAPWMVAPFSFSA